MLNWMLSREARLLSFDDFLLAMIERLNHAGLSLLRVSTSLRTFHPEVFVKNYQWRRDKGLVSILRPREVMTLPYYRESPIYDLHHLGIDEIRVDLRGPIETIAYEVCRLMGAKFLNLLAMPFLLFF